MDTGFIDNELYYQQWRHSQKSLFVLQPFIVNEAKSHGVVHVESQDYHKLWINSSPNFYSNLMVTEKMKE